MSEQTKTIESIMGPEHTRRVFCPNCNVGVDVYCVTKTGGIYHGSNTSIYHMARENLYDRCREDVTLFNRLRIVGLAGEPLSDGEAMYVAMQMLAPIHARMEKGELDKAWAKVDEFAASKD